MKYKENSIRNHGRLALWVFVVFTISTVVTSAQLQQTERLSVDDNRPVASAILSLETRFGRVITYEDPPLVHADDTVDVTESVRRDLHKYAPGKAPKVIVPRGGELSVEFRRNDPVEVVLSNVLGESARVSSATFATAESNGVIHVFPHSIKGRNGETVSIRSILDAPVQLSAQERTGMQMLEAWREAVSSHSRKKVIIGAVPFGMLLNYKDANGLSSQNARDGLTEILTRIGKGAKLSWQLFYDPGQQLYAINVHLVQ